VLVEDVHLATHREQLRIVEGVEEALERLRELGLVLVVVTNQTVVARGLASEDDVAQLHKSLGLGVDAWYVCPHHPSADVAHYRVACECRKPRPGLLLHAARELGIDLGRSYMVGDRASDVEAGRRAGCRTIRICSGAHLEPPIESPDAFDPSVAADHSCGDLREAASWIREQLQ
jgi:D-glycero-D-manno-heptose 1,7-bisphosphate phosphatase